MMRIFLPLALACLLNGCDQPPASVESPIVNNSVEPVQAQEPEARDNVVAPAEPEPAVATSGPIPVALRGRWTGVKDDCADRAAVQELNITANKLLFHESVGTVTGVSPRGEGRYGLDASFTGEGESWNRQIIVRRSADGQRLTVDDGAQAVVRKRCGDAA